MHGWKILNLFSTPTAHSVKSSMNQRWFNILFLLGCIVIFMLITFCLGRLLSFFRSFVRSFCVLIELCVPLFLLELDDQAMQIQLERAKAGISNYCLLYCIHLYVTDCHFMSLHDDLIKKVLKVFYYFEYFALHYLGHIIYATEKAICAQIM